MKIVQMPSFKKARKKLHKNQIADLKKAIEEIIENTKIGQQKLGDLRGIRVHKFKMVGQLTLIAYDYQDDTITLTLLAFGSHENFYRDLKRNLNS
ncbi:MAG: type II toxin-antitoxin system RelE/ParE family toxin [Bdellovibrionales bacterium]